MKIVWRFNLKEGVDEAEFFHWLKSHVWSSSEKYGCKTTAFKLEQSVHAYSTEAVWPDEESRQKWVRSEDFKNIQNYPGYDSPWGAQKDMESIVYHSLDV